MTQAPLLLEARSLCVRFTPAGGAPHMAVDQVSLRVNEGETLGVIGESGSGKTTLARALVGLQALTSGEIAWRGETLSRSGQRPVPARIARHAQFVFQDPASSLNPRKPAWWIATEPAALARPGLTRAARMDAAERLLARTGMTSSFLTRYPHQMSGGQRQRLSIARALSVEPAALILDEPTSALDMSVQAQILNELLGLNRKGLALILISHDLHVVRHLCARACVMRAGRVVEEGSLETLLSAPAHAYTKALIEAAAA